MSVEQQVSHVEIKVTDTSPQQGSKSRYYLTVFWVISVTPQQDIMETQGPYLSLYKQPSCQNGISLL